MVVATFKTQPSPLWAAYPLLINYFEEAELTLKI